MRELLQDVERLLSAYRSELCECDGGCRMPTNTELAVKAALSRSKWVKVADGLPVVPDGVATARIWLWRAGTPVRKGVWCAHFTEEELSDYTHWQYRQDDTPAPPEAS